MSAPALDRLESVNAIRAFQRTWLAETRERALAGEPFVICTSDECEEILAVLGIPVLVINYWNFVITAQRKARHFSQVLERRGYPGPHFFALGLAATLEPEEAPWGGLPKPALILGSTRHEQELKITELWARELGCPCYPLDFNFGSPYKRLPGDDWWATIRDGWEDLVDPARLALRIEQNKALVNYLEMLTGRAFSWQGLRQLMARLNEQMACMTRARDAIAAARACPVSLRDQIAAYQTNWHRGTEHGLDMARAYRDEVEQRAAAGVAAYRDERIRLLYWSMAEEPDFHSYIEETYGAVFVGAPYGAMPQTYARTVYNGDALRALSARHIFLFDMQSPSWMLREARQYGVDAIVSVEDPSPYPSVFRRACQAAGIPYLAVPRVRDDEEVRSVLDGFFREQLPSAQP
ncbi:MAG TPA: 2-hydroxyacyl-CoA dehydratase family protein [Chloroflexota bacterium]|nr:2-hydroxyacyl-CoA dehydratase family protein [Chloroflexota bacterium]